jgi:hypothetical protein
VSFITISLCPAEGQRSQFAQLYIHDIESKRQNHRAIMPLLDPTTLDWLLTMMYNINPMSKCSKLARDMMATKGVPTDLKLCFIAFEQRMPPDTMCCIDGRKWF